MESEKEPGKLALQGLNTATYLKAEPLLPAEHKAALATHLAAALNAPGDDPKDVAEGEAILRVIIWNTEGGVVESIAQAAASNPNMTKSLAWALANDDEAVAMPILKSSQALSDADLISIVEASESSAKMGAIACRPAVSADLSRSLALHGDEDTAHLLLNNANADIPEDALTNILERHEQHQKVVDGMAGRDTLSSAIAERLRDRVSPELAGNLRARHPEAASAEPALPRIDRNIMGYRDEVSAEALDDQVSQMIARNEITAQLLVEKICLGYFEFFISALASMSKLPKPDVRDRLVEASSKSLPDVWKAAALPMEWLPVAAASLSAFMFVQKNYSKSDIPKFRQNISGRVMANLATEKHTLLGAQLNFLRSL